jgi:hypothetical protein
LPSLLADAPFTSPSAGATVRVSRCHQITRHAKASRLFLCADIHYQQCKGRIFEAATAIQTSQRLLKLLQNMREKPAGILSLLLHSLQGRIRIKSTTKSILSATIIMQSFANF